MNVRRIVLIFFSLLLLPLGSHAYQVQSEAPPATLAATFDINPQELTGFSQQDDTLYLVASEGTFVSEPYEPGWEFIAVGVTWDEELPEGTTPLLDVRVSDDGNSWSDWIPLSMPEDDWPDGVPLTSSELLFAQGRQVQMKAQLQNQQGEPLNWSGLRLTVIDGRPGPSSEPDPVTSASVSSNSTVITRAEWGANEGYRFDSSGDEIWPREYWPLKALFVHHTATTSNPPDPYATVRSIYYFHAVTRGWGDIGYHYLIDQHGRTFQGRFGTEQNGLVVEGGHAYAHNENTMGVSMIGDFSSTGPGDAQMNTLKTLLANKAGTYGIDPYAPVWLNNRQFYDSLLGHRDTQLAGHLTTCPGEALYARLEEIRAYVASAPPPPPPTPAPSLHVDLQEPDEDELLEGTVTFEASANLPIERMDYYLDGSLVASSRSAPWKVEVDAASLPAGTFTLRATGTAANGTSASDENTIQVAEVSHPVAPPAPISRPAPDMRHLYLPVVGRRGATTPNRTESARPGKNYLPVIANSICRPLVSNPAFQTNTGWLMFEGSYAARFAKEQSLSQPRSLRVGMAPGDNVSSWSSAWLPVTIPRGVKNVTLSASYLPQTEDNSSGSKDLQYIGVFKDLEDESPTWVVRGTRVNSGWKKLTYDLSAFIGRSVYLYAGVYNDGAGGATRLYVDDIQITVCNG